MSKVRAPSPSIKAHRDNYSKVLDASLLVFGAGKRDDPFTFQLFDVPHEAMKIFRFVVFESWQLLPGSKIFLARFCLGADHR